MSTILEIATEAGVAPELVLRVVNGEAVSEEIGSRVRAAMQYLGRPAYPKPTPPEPIPPAAEASEARTVALERLADVAAELESTLPAEVGSVVYEAMRVEVRPVVEHVEGLQRVFEGLAHELRRLRSEVASERRDRVEDLALQVELMRAGWVGVDRRLGRIERALARTERMEAPRSALSRVEGLRPAEIVPVKEGNGSGLNGAGGDQQTG